MKIIIVGAGEVGRYLSQILSERDDDVTLIEASEEVAAGLDEEQDARVIVGNGASAAVLESAGVKSCDFFLAMTSHDQLNIVACSLANRLGAKYTAARIHDQVYSDISVVNYQEHFNIDYLLNPEALCAVEFAKAIRNPERVAVEDFARGEIEVQRVEVAAESKILNKPFRNIKFPQGVRLGYVQRGGKMFIATAETELKEGDIVTVLGSSQNLFEQSRIFTGEKSLAKKSIVIYGATDIAISLVRLLSHPRFQIRIIEPDMNLCRALAEKFPRATIINGSATSLKLLEEVDVGKCDYFVACTRDDEENIMTGLQAKKLGAGHIHLAINKPDYEPVLNNLSELMGLDLVLSPRRATASEILRYVSKDKFAKVGKLDDENVELIEVRVSEKSACAGKKISEANLPHGCIIAALMHKNTSKVPSAGDEINAGDRLIVILSKENVKKVVSLVVG